MRRAIIGCCLVGALTIPIAVNAQPSSRIATDAERAAAAAERAARAAEAAAAAANEAAAAARQATQGAASSRPPVKESTDSAEKLWDFEPPQAELQTRFVEAVQESVANGPSYRSHKTTGSPEFQLVAGDDKTVASISLTMDITGLPASGGDKLNSTMLTVTASRDLAKSGPTTFGDLSGLADGTEIKLSLTHYVSRFRPDALNLEPEKTAIAECLRQEAKNPDKVKTCTPEQYDFGTTAFVAKYNPMQARSYVDSVLPGPVVFYGIEAKMGQANFAYLDQANFVMQEVSRFSYAGTLFAGTIFDSGNTSLGGSFTVSRQRKAQDPITLCQAINAIPQTQCITAAAGAPNLKRKAIFGVELRHAFAASMGEFAKFAISPQVNFDVVSDAYSIDFPVYLVGDGKGKLRGGFRAGYTNQKKAGGGRDDDFNLGLFVGVPFSVFR